MQIFIFTVQADYLVLIDTHWSHEAETDPDSMQNTALTFIFLFLITLVYCIGTTIIKVWTYDLLWRIIYNNSNAQKANSVILYIGGDEVKWIKNIFQNENAVTRDS